MFKKTKGLLFSDVFIGVTVVRTVRSNYALQHFQFLIETEEKKEKGEEKLHANLDLAVVSAKYNTIRFVFISYL